MFEVFLVFVELVQSLWNHWHLLLRETVLFDLVYFLADLAYPSALDSFLPEMRGNI